MSDIKISSGFTYIHPSNIDSEDMNSEFLEYIFNVDVFKPDPGSIIDAVDAWIEIARFILWV